jgi:hypothetical protein
VLIFRCDFASAGPKESGGLQEPPFVYKCLVSFGAFLGEPPSVSFPAFDRHGAGFRSTGILTADV